jgi:hypothetical protein
MCERFMYSCSENLTDGNRGPDLIALFYHGCDECMRWAIAELQADKKWRDRPLYWRWTLDGVVNDRKAKRD